MADVNRTDRGQLLIIVGLLLAVLFVALALILNGAIYAENLSTRDSGSETSTVLEQRTVFANDLQSTIDNVNENHRTSGEFSEVDEPFRNIADDWSTSLEKDNARAGRIAATNVTSTTQGAELSQSDQNRNFTAGGTNAGDPDWALATDVTDAGTFEFEVSDDDLLDMTGNNANQLLDDVDNLFLGGLLFHETFHVEIETADGDTWRVYMFQVTDLEEDTLYLYTEEPGEDILTMDQTLSSFAGESCSAPIEGGSAHVDLRNGEAGGEECEDLAFYEEEVVDTDHEISFRNARTDGLSEAEAQQIVDAYDDTGRLDELEDVIDSLFDLLGLGSLFSDTVDDVLELWEEAGLSGDRASGTYDIVADSTGERQNFDAVDGGNPTARTIVFSADLEIVHQSGDARLTTETEVRWSEAEP